MQITLCPGENLDVPEIGSDFLAGKIVGSCTFSRPVLPDLPLEALISICPSPTCPCPGFEIGFPPTENVPTPRVMGIDFHEKTIFPAGNEAPDSRPTAEAIQAQLEESDWADLRELFYRAKADFIDAAAPPFDVDEAYFAGMIGDGAMIGYHEVFPLAGSIAFDAHGQRWFLDERYCARPGCGCDDACVQVFPLNGSGADSKPELGFLYNHKRDVLGKTFRHSPQLSVRTVMEALRRDSPEWRETMDRRHAQLRALGEQVTAHTRRKPLQRTAPETNRNDPCPCGSGKKYKKCCGKP